MFFASLLEVVSIGAVLPFLGALAAPDLVFSHALIQPLIQKIGVDSPDQILFPLAVLFGSAVLVAGFVRLLLLWATTRLSFATGADLSGQVYEKTLYQPYSVHIELNSSDLIGAITGKSNGIVYTTILPVLNLCSAFLMLVAILAVLLVIDPIVALIAFSGFSIVYLLLVFLTKGRLKRNSVSIARQSTKVIKILQEGLGGIRDVLIDGSQGIYTKAYRQADSDLRHAQGDSLFIGQSPRYGMEVFGMLVIIALAYFLASKSGGVGGAIPVLGALALGAQRLLPVLQQAYVSWSSIRGGQASLQDTLNLLNQPMPVYASQKESVPLTFVDSIWLRDVGFRHAQQNDWIFRNVSLKIPKGSRVGLVGKTGSGKSTLVDIVTGLLSPTEGAIHVDGQQIIESNQRSWQARVAHVPQNIFLSDASIKENIAFGVPRGGIDVDRLRYAVAKAQLTEFVDSLPLKYDTMVGERGVRLSGGQRQRIGIARALYKRADVIIFDEATSALDMVTEEAVMRSIDDLDKDLTIFIIAHRVTTLKNCTLIVRVGGGGVEHVDVNQHINV